MKNQDTSFYGRSDKKATKSNTLQTEKTWDGPLLEQERTAKEEQDTINERLADKADKNEGSDNPPLRNELDPPTAPDIIPDQSPDEINYPGKKDFPQVEQPKFSGSSSSIGNEDAREEKGEEAQEIQIREEEERQEKIKEKEAELREAREGREESIRKSEDGNLSDNRGYNEIRENSPVANEKDKEFLN